MESGFVSWWCCAGPICAVVASRMKFTEEELELSSSVDLLAVCEVGVRGVGDGVLSSFLRFALERRVKREVLGFVFVGLVVSLGFLLTTLRAGGVSDSASWASLFSISRLPSPLSLGVTAASEWSFKVSLPILPTVESERSSFLLCERVKRRRWPCGLSCSFSPGSARAGSALLLRGRERSAEA